MIWIRLYQADDRQRCLDIFDSNTPQYFAPAKRTQFCIWLDARDKGTKAYEDTQAEYYYVIGENNTVAGCGGFGIHGEGSTATMAWGMIDRAWHKKGLAERFLPAGWNK